MAVLPYGDDMNTIRRNAYGTTITGIQDQHLNKGMQSILNQIALQGGSTLQGRMEASRYLLKITQNPPIYLSPDIILIPLSSLRSPNTVFINYCKILMYQAKPEGIQIIFLDGTEEILPLSFQVFRKRIILAEQLATILKR